MSSSVGALRDKTRKTKSETKTKIKTRISSFRVLFLFHSFYQNPPRGPSGPRVPDGTLMKINDSGVKDRWPERNSRETCQLPHPHGTPVGLVLEPRASWGVETGGGDDLGRSDSRPTIVDVCYRLPFLSFHLLSPTCSPFYVGTLRLFSIRALSLSPWTTGGWFSYHCKM